MAICANACASTYGLGCLWHATLRFSILSRQSQLTIDGIPDVTAGSTFLCSSCSFSSWHNGPVGYYGDVHVAIFSLHQIQSHPPPSQVQLRYGWRFSMRRRDLGWDHLDQRGLNTISFQRRNNAFKAVDQGALLKLSPLSPSNRATKENGADQNSGVGVSKW